MADKFKVDQDEVAVDQLLYNLDRKKDAYIRSQNWDAEKQKAFNEQYNKVRAGIADGTVSGRGADRSYVDSSQSFKNATEGYDSVGEVFRYVDRILDARTRKTGSSSSGSKKKYTNDLLQAFVNDQFGGNSELDMKAWETDDYNSETGEYITDNRKRKMAEFLTRYRDNLGDFDYEGSAFKSADDLKGRLNKAINALNDGSDFSDELGALGFGERFRSNMFRTKNGLYESDDDLLRKHGLDWAIDATPEQKAEVLASIRAGKTAGTNANYEEWKSKQNKLAHDKEWDDFVAQSKKEGTFENNIAFGGNLNDEYTAADLEDISKAWNNLDSFTAQNLQKQFASNLGKYMSGDSSVNWDTELQNYYKQLMQGNEDFREDNRDNFWTRLGIGISTGATTGAGIGAVGGLGIGALPGALAGGLIGGIGGMAVGYDDSDKHKWSDQAMLNEYRTLVQMGHNKGQVINPIEGNKNEFFVPGAWNLEKKEFYTYNPTTHTIHKHKLHESDMLMKEYRKVWEKEKEGAKKMQQGGVFDAFMSTLGKPQDATDPLKNKSVSEIKEEKRQEAGKRVVSEDLRPEDFVRFGAMAADVTALVASFAPGYGTAASGVLSLGSTAADLTADIMDDSVSAGQVMTNLGTNLGMAVLGLIPGGKSAGIASKIAKWTPKIIAAATAANLAFNDDIHKSLGKLTSSEKLTVDDWKNVGIALSSVSGLTRSGKAAYQARQFKNAKTPTGNVEISIKGNDKAKLELSQEELKVLGSKKSNQEAIDYLASIGKLTKNKDGKVVDGKGKVIEIGEFIKDGRTFDNWFGLNRNNIKVTKKFDEGLANPERVALEKARIQNANIADDSSWWKQMTTGDVRLATDYEMYEGSLPIKGIKMPDTGITKWFKDLVKDDFAEQYRARQKQSKEWLRSGSSGSGAQAQPGTTAPRFDVSWEGQTQVGKGKRMHYRVPTGKKGRVSKEYLDYLRSLGIDPKTSPRYAAHNTRGWLNDPTPRRIAFEGSDGNVYYWKDGGIVKANTGTQVKRRNVINNGADWNKHIWCSEGLISTLSGIQANEEDLKRYNDLQNSYSKLGFTDAAPGDNLTFNQGVADYQGAFENLTDINGGTIAGLIQQGVLQGRGGSSDKTDLWKGDGLAGTQTWLRHLGTNFTSKDQLAKYNEMGLHKDIEAFINPETNMVNFRLRQTTQTPPVETPPQTTPVKGTPDPAGTVKGSGNDPIPTNTTTQNFGGPKKSELINNMRYLLATKHNDEMVQDGIQGLRAGYVEPGYIQKHLRVQNNLSEGEPYKQAGIKVLNQINMNKTSDAINNNLMMLLGQSPVNDYDIQRGAVLDKNVEAQKTAALAQEHANQDVVHTTNEARKEKRAALAKSIADIKQAGKFKNWEATDLKLKGDEANASQKELAVDAQRWDNFQNQAQLEMQDALYNKKKEWLASNPGKTESDWAKSNEYSDLSRQLQIDRANKLRQYRRQYYGIPFKPFQPGFDATGLETLKKGGKVDDSKTKKRIETAKLVQKNILDQVKHGDKQLDRFSKITQKAIIKALGL